MTCLQTRSYPDMKKRSRNGKRKSENVSPSTQDVVEHIDTPQMHQKMLQDRVRGVRQSSKCQQEVLEAHPVRSHDLLLQLLSVCAEALLHPCP